jgi:long-chain fatty acid transport protein
VAIRVGASFALSEQIALRAGVAFDETPVPDATRGPQLPDSDRTWLAVGARWNRGALTLDFGLAHLFAETVSLAQDALTDQLSLENCAPAVFMPRQA